MEGGGVPYKQIAQLPDGVKNNLPKHAQEIYRAAINSAEEQYGEERATPRRLERRREEGRLVPEHPLVAADAYEGHRR